MEIFYLKLRFRRLKNPLNFYKNINMNIRRAQFAVKAAEGRRVKNKS